MSVHKSRAPQFTLVFSGVYHVHFKRYTDVATDLSLTWTTLYTLQTMSYNFFFLQGLLTKNSYNILVKQSSKQKPF